MPRTLPAALLPAAGAALLLAARLAAAQPTDPVIAQPWARAAAAGGTGAAYLSITAQQADQLTGASTPAAGMAELHLSRNTDGVMQMRSSGGLDLPPGKPVILAPGSYHLMLMDLKQPLKRGDSFPLTLTFANAPPQTVQVAVKAAGASKP